MKRMTIAAVLLLGLSGCGVLGGDGDKKTRTPLLGERIPILSRESGVEVDPALAAVPVVVPPAYVNSEWAQPRGNAAKVMGHPALGSALARAWTVSVAGNSKKTRLAAGPVVANDTVYVIDTNAVVHAFDSATGGQRWRTSLSVKGDGEKAVFGGGVSYADGRLYATNGVGEVAALDAGTGNILWRVRPGGPLRGAPTLFNNQIFVISQDNQIFALASEDGRTIWNEAGSLENSGIFGVAPPAAAQGTVIAGFSSGELTAYRYENGRAVWQDALSRTSISTSVASLADIDASPVIDEGRVYAIGQGGRMVALELVTGQRMWELNVSGLSTPWVAGDWIFVVTDQGQVLCIAKTSGKIRWISKVRQWRNPEKKDRPIFWTGPILAGDRLILASSEGEMLNMSITDGSIGTQTKLQSGVNVSPVVANNTLFILDSDGRLTAWR